MDLTDIRLRKQQASEKTRSAIPLCDDAQQEAKLITMFSGTYTRRETKKKQGDDLTKARVVRRRREGVPQQWQFSVWGSDMADPVLSGDMTATK